MNIWNGAKTSCWLGSLLTGLVLTIPAQALTFQLIDVGATPMTAQQLAAFQQATAIWSTRFTDPITIKLNIAWDNPETFSNASVLASTSSARSTHTLAITRFAMFLDGYNSLEKAVDLQIPSPSMPTITTLGTGRLNRVTMTTANAKAMHLSSGLDPTYGDAQANNADATIRYNKAFASSFDLDRSDGIAAGRYDFIGVAAHEIGHALGFISLTDVQDANPGFTLYPSPLDLWRFSQTGGNHSMATDNRMLTANPAEYFDSSMNNVAFSQGINLIDAQCNTSTSRCQASHWRDNVGAMMDPSVGRGILINPTWQDKHAIDYFGYDPRPFWVFLRPWRFLELHFLPLDCLVCMERVHATSFPGYPQPWVPAKTGFIPDMWLMMNLDLGNSKGPLSHRLLMGQAAFLPATDNPQPIVLKPVTPVPGRKGEYSEEEVVSQGAMKLIPPRLTHLVLESDRVNGPHIMLTGDIPEGGVQWDPTEGPFGGFRLGLLVDSTQDNVNEPDQDALLTLVLRLNSRFDGTLASLMKMVPVVSAKGDSGMMIADNKALGLPISDQDRDGIPDQDDNCVTFPNPKQYNSNAGPGPDSDGIGNRCDPDLDNDGRVNTRDFGLFKQAFQGRGSPQLRRDADLDGNGRVNTVDFGLFKRLFGRSPGPGTAP